jgi:hypothetical protein
MVPWSPHHEKRHNSRRESIACAQLGSVHGGRALPLDNAITNSTVQLRFSSSLLATNVKKILVGNPAR